MVRVSFIGDEVSETCFYWQDKIDDIVINRHKSVKGKVPRKNMMEIVYNIHEEHNNILSEDPHPTLADTLEPKSSGYRSKIWYTLARANLSITLIDDIYCFDTDCRLFKAGRPCECEEHVAVAHKAVWDDEKQCATRAYFLLTGDDEADVAFSSLAEMITADAAKTSAPLNPDAIPFYPTFPSNPNAAPFFPTFPHNSKAAPFFPMYLCSY